jgi:glycerol-3-phosphate acyltransferase PlsY
MLGSIPFSYFVARWKTGGDIRRMGSGNVGATNVLRTSGKLAGVSALFFDTAKGAAAVVIGHSLTDSTLFGAITGFAAVVGHSFPVFLGFRGGKSVATGAGAFAMLSPFGILSSIAVFVVLLKLTRIVSLSSMIASASFPMFAWIYGSSNGIVLWGALSAAWIIMRHHENLTLLIKGKERRLGDPEP